MWKDPSTPLPLIALLPGSLDHRWRVISLALAGNLRVSGAAQESSHLCPALQPHWPLSPLVSELDPGSSLCTEYAPPFTLLTPVPAGRPDQAPLPHAKCPCVPFATRITARNHYCGVLEGTSCEGRPCFAHCSIPIMPSTVPGKQWAVNECCYYHLLNEC